jgi:3-deoxy-D-manno-octulosonic-acid transferase
VSFIYSVLATLLYLLALPVLMYLSSKPKYKHSIPARFFLKQNPPFAKEGIWFHACSLGEVRSLKPFLEALNAFPLRISTITQTGHKEALQFPTVDVRYLPFEIFLPFWMSKQRVLVVLEAELWPLLFVVAKAKGIKTILLNARISDKSYASYQRFAFFYRWIFAHIDVVFAQSERDQQRLHSLGRGIVLSMATSKPFSAMRSRTCTKNLHLSV